jgi:hypothetical protein
MAKKTEVVEIKPIEMRKVKITIEGDTPLIMHAWSEKAKREMLDAQQGKKKGKQKDPKNPVNDFVQSMYWLKGKPEMDCHTDEIECQKMFTEAIEGGARFGFPVTAFKQAAISAAYRMGWSKDKVSLQGAFFLEDTQDGMLEIKGDAPVMREDMVKIGMGTADIRYRGEFRNLYAEAIVTYNANGQYDLNAIINMINAGGTYCGIGEWRVEKSGQNGMYHVALGE